MVRTLLGIALIAGGALVLATRRKPDRPEQDAADPRQVGIFLTGPVQGPVAEVVEVFKNEMRCLGWIEGEHIIYDVHAAPRHLRGDEEIRDHAIQLLRRDREVIWLVNTGNALAVADAQNDLEAWMQIPVVGASVSKEATKRAPLSRRTNSRFVVNLSGELGSARLRLVKELLLSNEKPLTLAVFHTRFSSEEELAAIQREADCFRITVRRVKFDNYDESDGDLRRRFADLAQGGVQAVLTAHDHFFRNTAERMIPLSTAEGLPFIGYRASFVRLGAVMSYGTSLRKQLGLSADLVHAILRGKTPAQRAIKPNDPELWINLAAANKLALTIPCSLWAKARDNIIGWG